MRQILLLAVLIGMAGQAPVVLAQAAQAQGGQPQGGLKPEEVGILIAAGNRESAALGKYYAEKRGIPIKNVCLVELPKGMGTQSESITFEAWESAVRPIIRSWLAKEGRQQRIRCLVTTWGLPIRIQAAPAERIRDHKDFYDTKYADRLDRLTKRIEQFEAMSGKESGVESEKSDESEPVPDKTPPHGKLVKRLAVAFTNAQQKAQQLPKNELPGYLTKLEQTYAQCVGPAGLFEGLARALSGETTPSADRVGQRERLRGRILGLNEARGWISQNQLPSLERENVQLGLIERVGGLVQALNWLHEQREVVKKNETTASFDSELSLILWPEYERLRWQTNYLNARASQSMAEANPIIMVSRIDGPTLKLAKGLIDNAIKAEKNGLQGKVYLDARGLVENATAPTKDQSTLFDRQILGTGEFLKKAGLDVVVNNETELFQEGECPDAALYCGWYSLADYVDAFDWNPGAVAYHVASAEATTLKKAESNVWCKRLIEDGVCATLGPVAEPYLQAFPPPGEFFPTLVSGRFTLVETYYRTKPFNSWMMMLLGDPLYRPFQPRGTE